VGRYTFGAAVAAASRDDIARVIAKRVGLVKWLTDAIAGAGADTEFRAVVTAYRDDLLRASG
jgi:hypothetical protein